MSWDWVRKTMVEGKSLKGTFAYQTKQRQKPCNYLWHSFPYPANIQLMIANFASNRFSAPCPFLYPSLSYMGEGNGNPLQYSCLENPMDGGAWWAAVNGIARSRTRLSDFTFAFHFHALEKEMATHSSVLAWRLPRTGEPGGLPSMGLHRVGQDWLNLATAAAVY